MLRFGLLGLLSLLFFAQPSMAAEVVTEPAYRPVTLSGFTRARQNLPMAFEIPGRVISVNADVGDQLRNDQAYACLDTTFVELDRVEVRNGRKRTEADIKYFEAQVKRLRRLAAKNNSAQSQLDDSERQLAASRADLARAGTQDRILAERQRRHCVSAPQGWLLTQRKIEPGQWINSGEPIGMAGNFASLLIPLAVTPQELAVLRTTNPLIVRLPELGADLAARIERVSPAFDPSTRKLGVDLAIDPPAEHARGGLLAELSFQLPSAGMVQIAISAVNNQYEEDYLLRPDGSRLRVRVLGPSADAGKVLVSAPELSAGQSFQVP